MGPAARQSLDDALTRHGKQHEVKVYPGTHHGFFNDTRQEVYASAAAADAWGSALRLFRDNL